MATLLALAACTSLAASQSTAGAAADKITSLPGYTGSDSMYSGYVTVSPTNGRSLFYYFTESRRSAANDPLVVWLNGGPGCSSLGGLLSELGFGWVQQNGTVQENPWAWNSVANMLFIESPRDVGFSYSNTSMDAYVGDQGTSEDLYTFLQLWLERFPEFAGRPFWITGESYGGHYVPSFANAVVDGNAAIAAGKQPATSTPIANPQHINIQGFLVGNAWTWAPLDNAGAAIDWWTHGVVSDEAVFGIFKTCNLSDVGPLRRSLRSGSSAAAGATGPFTPALVMGQAAAAAAEAAGARYTESCDFYQNLAFAQMGNVNIYDLTALVCVDQSTGQVRQHAEVAHFLEAIGRGSSAVQAVSTDDDATSAGSSDTQAGGAAQYDPCIDGALSRYLNRADVQAAIHAIAPGQPAKQWDMCSNTLHYSRESLLSSMLPIYRKLIAAGLSVNVYSGDIDGIVPITGTRTWIDQLGLPIAKAWRPWLEHKQTGGFVTQYDGLRFITVRNAGHMVPYTQPARALHMFAKVTQGKEL